VGGGDGCGVDGGVWCGDVVMWCSRYHLDNSKPNKSMCIYM